MVMPIGTSTKPKNSGATTPLVSRTALSRRPHNMLERRSKRAAPKANIRRRLAYLFDQLIAPAHSSAPVSSASSPASTDPPLDSLLDGAPVVPVDAIEPKGNVIDLALALSEFLLCFNGLGLPGGDPLGERLAFDL